MLFEWDPVKARANERKHTVSFEEAVSIFRSFRIDRTDTRKNYGEERVIGLGIDSNGVILNVVYTLRGESIRIISAWKASKHERQIYAKAYSDRPLQEPRRYPG